jgi:hypothetical protein
MWSGVTLDSGSSGIIRNCQFSQGFERYAIAATFSSSIQLNGCHVDGATEGVLVTMGSSLTGSGNVIANTTEVGLWIRSQSTVSLENSHLLPAIGPAVKCSYFLNPPDIFQNLSNNYWGTTDPAQIEGMIEDGNDDSGEHSFVNFSPYAGQPVSTENMTMDGLKALFR